MASPKVFISSTCYDLKYIRENLKYFVKTIGYEPILSEEGDVFYNPEIHTHDSCIEEIPNSQIFVLIIGGRYGGEFRDSTKSITNHEYKEAVRLKIPIFTLVEESVYSEHFVYTKNRRNIEIDFTKIQYPSVDNIKIFDFIDEVRKSTLNNAIVPFRNFTDIEDYLKKQWAGMMFNFLVIRNEENRLLDTLDVLSSMNERIEIISQQILNTVGTDESNITVKLYEGLLDVEAFRYFGFLKIKPTPKDILKIHTLDNLFKEYNKDISISEDKGFTISSSSMSKPKYDSFVKDYQVMREILVDILQSNNMTPEAYIEMIEAKEKDKIRV